MAFINYMLQSREEEVKEIWRFYSEYNNFSVVEHIPFTERLLSALHEYAVSKNDYELTTDIDVAFCLRPPEDSEFYSNYIRGNEMFDFKGVSGYMELRDNRIGNCIRILMSSSIEQMLFIYIDCNKVDDKQPYNAKHITVQAFSLVTRDGIYNLLDIARVYHFLKNNELAETIANKLH